MKSKLLIIIIILSIFFMSCGTAEKDLSSDKIDYSAEEVKEHSMQEETLMPLPEEDVIASKNEAEIQQEEYTYFLPPEYNRISALSEGYIRLLKGDFIQYMNVDGHVISSTSEYVLSGIYQGKICIKSTKDATYGLMDRNGNILIAPQYEDPLEFSDGLSYVMKDGKVGYINMDNELIIDYKYDFGMPYSDGLAAVGIGEKFWFINTVGDIVSGPHIYFGSEIFTFTPAYMEYYENYTVYFEYDDKAPPAAYNPGGVWGYQNEKGEKVIPAQYISARPFHDGLAAVQKQDENWVYINKEGKEVFDGGPCDFNGGLALSGGHVVDTIGEILFDIPEGYIVDGSTAEGIHGFQHGLLLLYKDNWDICAIMNSQGEILMESEADEFDEVSILNENMIAVKLKATEKWGIIEFPNEIKK